MSRLERNQVGATEAALSAIAQALDVPVCAISTGGLMMTSTIDARAEAHELADTELWTVKEAALRLRLTEDWLSKAVKRGDIGHVRIGRQPRISANNIRAFIAKNHVPAKDEQPTRRGRKRAAA
jgi:excisionase family DNA binding protein